jgi:hypothetical protein
MRSTFYYPLSKNRLIAQAPSIKLYFSPLRIVNHGIASNVTNYLEAVKKIEFYSEEPQIIPLP